MDKEKVMGLVESIIVHAEDENTRRSWDSDDVGWKNTDRIWDSAQQLKELLKEQEAELCDRCGRIRLKSSRTMEGAVK